MSTTRLLYRFTYFLIALIVVTSAGCDSNKDEAGDAPDLFPAEAFTMQTDLFNQNLAPKQAVGINFAAAALRVWPVSLALGANLIIPSALTTSALQAEAVSEDDSWVWAATAVANGVSTAYSLIGTRHDEGTDWSMRITVQGGMGGETLDDFELFTGRTTDDGASGNWSLFYPIDGVSTNVLSAEYAIVSETEKTITYTIPVTAEDNAGDTIEYAEIDSLRTFDWLQAAASIQHFVTWSASDSTGSITASNFRSGVKSCWDSLLNDTPCPAETRLP
ncbi:MAG: hypothetical protein SH809_08890 [Rhodothermales bacterium]|nr:hypothetical protein [Rhodothermales bacterium]